MHYSQLFNDKADLYERARPVYPAAIYDYLASITPARNLAWDAACGNGQAAIGLVEKFNTIYATDISHEQIANAKLHERIRYEQSASEVCRLDSSSCDLVCVAQALHWLDLDLFWPEVNRVLTAGGIFSAWGYNWATIDKPIDDVVERAILKIIQPYWARQNQLLWNAYQDIRFPFVKMESPAFKLNMQWNFYELLNFLHSFSATRRAMDAMGGDFFQAGGDELAKAWDNPDDRKNVQLGFVFYAGKKIADARSR